MWASERLRYRQVFYEAWKKKEKPLLLSALEHQVLEIMALHPEYQFIFEDESLIERDYFPVLGETNPFLHLGLHLGLLEQLHTNRPVGIREIYSQLLEKKKEAHAVQHAMMERINHMMYQAARRETVLDDALYLHYLREIE